MSDVRVIDVFCYNGEPIVAHRLHTLSPMVYHFYIVESRQTLDGKSKPELFRDIHSQLFEPYKDKITWVILDDIGETNTERYASFQRNAVMSAVRNESKTVMMVCECDEIPSPETVEKLRNEPPYDPIALEMTMVSDSSKWTSAYAISLDAARSYVYGSDISTIRTSPKSKTILNAGEKLRSY
jgi:hypothetical protein